jgi:hypothetical protein
MPLPIGWRTRSSGEKDGRGVRSWETRIGSSNLSFVARVERGYEAHIATIVPLTITIAPKDRREPKIDHARAQMLWTMPPFAHPLRNALAGACCRCRPKDEPCSKHMIEIDVLPAVVIADEDGKRTCQIQAIDFE